MTTGERFVLVTVKIAPTGPFCREPGYGATCPYLDTDVGLHASMRCLLHRDPKGEPTDLEDHDTLGGSGDLDFFQPKRTLACLALDKPNAPGAAERERTPEEAMAHGFGSQP